MSQKDIIFKAERFVKKISDRYLSEHDYQVPEVMEDFLMSVFVLGYEQGVIDSSIRGRLTQLQNKVVDLEILKLVEPDLS